MMFKDFIKSLCQVENLVDIGIEGIVTQSSKLDWIRPNEGKNAVTGKHFEDFAFHTDKEKNPWWQIEFDAPKLVWHIIINNRTKKPWDKTAINIKVVATLSDDREIVIHEGNVLFGNIKDSVPLILPLYGHFLLKKIRIYLPNFAYLHLSNIHVLVKDSLTLQQKYNVPIFFANRTDGFGERLRAILNAIVAAKITDGRFFFSWESDMGIDKTYHAIDNDILVFDSSFIQEHCLKKQKIDELNLVNIKNIKNIKLNNMDGILVEQRKLIFQNEIFFKQYNFSNELYQEAFNTIKFSNLLNKSKSMAENIVFNQKCVAIHLRAGDLVYGEFRFMTRYYNKVIPLYALDFLVKTFKKKNFQVLIFGQDEEFCRKFCGMNNLIYTKDLARDFSNSAQSALFDIVLMSRCEIVIAAYSGFAHAAGWIGNRKVSNIDEYLTEIDLINEFEVAYSSSGLLQIEEVSPLLKSFTIAQFLYNFRSKISLDKAIELIENCIKLDSINSNYKIMRACLYYEKGQSMIADSILLEEIESSTGDKVSDIIFLIKRVHPDGTTQLYQYLDFLKFASQKNSAVATVILLFHDYYHQFRHYHKAVDFAYYEILLNNFKDKNVLGIDLLESKINYFKSEV